MVGLVAFPCRAFRQIPASLSTASLLCLTADPCRAFGAFLPFGPGKVAKGWRTAAGVPEIPRARVVLGNPGCRGLVGMEALTARQGSQRGPAARDGFGFLRGIQPGFAFRCFSAGPPRRSRRRFAALLCCTSRHSRTMPSALPCAAAWGDSAERWESGVSRARGHGSADGAAGERAGARGRGGVRDFSGNSTMVGLVAFLCRAFRQISAALSNTSLLCLTAHPCYAIGGFLRFSSGWRRGWWGFGVPLGHPGCRGLAGMRA